MMLGKSREAEIQDDGTFKPLPVGLMVVLETLVELSTPFL